MEVGDVKGFFAVITDKSTVMQAFHRKLKDQFYWILTFPCFLHGVNIIISEICSFLWLKKTTTKTTRIVTFFNNSHYWGGQLKEKAARQDVKCSLKKNCKSCWYALILQASG
ncbi:hypothetical protein OG21DRAFT_1418728 [Imleria badia]|nr:hypothetical protein OG21DRAFT_1418728 [Imleria badia]